MSAGFGVAIFVVLWWLAFFAVLPIGARSLHEADEAAAPGVERGAPQRARLGLKAVLAGGIAGLVWLAGALGICLGLFA
jgi:predicted secreted protein